MISKIKELLISVDNRKHVLLLILIAIVSHINWFSFHNIINFGDQTFFHTETLKEFYFSSGTWWSQWNLGIPNAQLFNFPIYGLSSFLANIKLNYAFIFNFTYLIPIAILGFISPYILAKKLVKNNFIAFVVALFYGSTTNFLIRQNSYAGIAFVEALAPLIFYFFILVLEKNKKINWIYFIFLYCVGVFYEIRITYLLSFILIIYFIIFYLKQIRKYWKNIIFFVLIAILLNIFWLLPILAGSASGRLDFLIIRSLSNNFQYNIINAFSIFNFTWTEITKIKFENAYYLWMIPIIAFSSLLFLKPNKKYKKEIIFFAIISLIGIILTKQVARPFTNLFPWLRENVPGFIMFRDSYKFYFITSLGYLGLLSYVLFFLKSNKSRSLKYIYYFFTFLIVIVSFLNLLPFLQQKLDTNKIKTVQPDYLIFKDFVINQKEFFRFMEVPMRFRWMAQTLNHPGVSVENILYYGSLEFNKRDSTLKDRNEKDIELFKENYSDDIIDSFSVKYVTVPSRDMQWNRDIWEIFFGDVRQFYIDELNKLSYLKEIDIGTKELVVYENENYKPHIYSDNGLNYYQSNESEFGDFSQNQNLYLNSEIEKHENLLGNLSNIIIPIEADPNKIAEMKLAVDKMTELIEKKKLQSDLDLYTNNSFLKDFKLKIPAKAIYKIYIKKDSVLANNKNIGVKIDSYVLEKDEMGIDKEGWSYFNQVELDKREYGFNLYVGNELTDYINSGDIILSAENLVEPIQTPQLEYKQINPTKYIVNVHQASQSFPLIFSESFHPDWKIYVQSVLADQGAGKFVSENNQGTIQNENLDSGHFYDIFSRKPVLSDKHFMVNSFANAWWVDLNEVCGLDFRLRGNDKAVCIKNVDGTYDFSIIIEFEPQKFFYIGLFISGLTLISCIGYLVYDWRKRKKSLSTSTI